VTDRGESLVTDRGKGLVTDRGKTFVIFLRRAAAARILFATLAPPASASDERPAREARRVFEAYIDARNRHDPEGIAALTSPSIRAVDAEGKAHPYDEKHLRDVLAWEAGIHARWHGREIGWDGRFLEIEASEENDLYDLLGVGAAVQRDRLRIEDGRIVEWYGLGERTTGRDEGEALSAFKAWIETLPRDLGEGIVRNGRLVIDGASSAKMRPLLDRWQREHPPLRDDAGPGSAPRRA